MMQNDPILHWNQLDQLDAVLKLVAMNNTTPKIINHIDLIQTKCEALASLCQAIKENV